MVSNRKVRQGPTSQITGIGSGSSSRNPRVLGLLPQDVQTEIQHVMKQSFKAPDRRKKFARRLDRIFDRLAIRQKDLISARFAEPEYFEHYQEHGRVPEFSGIPKITGFYGNGIRSGRFTIRDALESIISPDYRNSLADKQYRRKFSSEERNLIAESVFYRTLHYVRLGEDEQ